MKKIFFTLGLVLVSFIGNSQELYKYVDEMTEKTYFFDSGTYHLNEETKSGYRLDGLWDVRNGGPYFRGFTAKVVGIGSCVESVQLIILFENGEKIQKVSWNDFNCEGNCYYRFTESECEMLRTMSISKIRFQNGRTYESITGAPNNPRFFIEINEKAKNGNFTVKTQ